jgi:hypothetical protein
VKAVAALAAMCATAAADPALPRVVTAPTAWIPDAGEGVLTAGIDFRGDTLVGATLGLGGIASIELDDDSTVRACEACDQRAQPVELGRADFRLALHQGRWRPALAFGVRNTFGAAIPHTLAQLVPAGDSLVPRVTEAYLVASRELLPGRWRIRLHAGGIAQESRIAGLGTGLVVRPVGGVELGTPQYPRTTLIGDLAWVPDLNAATGPVTSWIAGWGVRYAAWPWANVELDVRNREGEGLGDTTVMLRIDLVTQRP